MKAGARDGTFLYIFFYLNTLLKTIYRLRYPHDIGNDTESEGQGQGFETTGAGA
jgi:hypothetical protein